MRTDLNTPGERCEGRSWVTLQVNNFAFGSFSTDLASLARRSMSASSSKSDRIAASEQNDLLCQGTKSLRDSGELRLVLSDAPGGEIVGSGGSFLS